MCLGGEHRDAEDGREIKLIQRGFYGYIWFETVDLSALKTKNVLGSCFMVRVVVVVRVEKYLLRETEDHT